MGGQGGQESPTDQEAGGAARKNNRLRFSAEKQDLIWGVDLQVTHKYAFRVMGESKIQTPNPRRKKT